MYYDALPLDLQSQYSINELIFINSGSNYYSRLPMAISAALYAGNNEGKTSSLSAIKLFLLPEVSFKRSASKFNFSSGGTTFSDIDSLTYYFPSTESYIICEAENPSYPQGFCWVLFKSTHFHYGRIAVPHPYNHIEHLFWNSESTSNEGVGALHDDISVSQIKTKLLSKYDGQLIIDKKIIAEAIYSRTSIKEDHTKFCLLPMIHKSSADSIKTVRALLDMAFDLSNASTQSLPVAIGSIIDSQGNSVVRDDGIFLDLEDKLEEWDELQHSQKLLAQIEEKKPQWQLFKKKVAQYQQQKSTVQGDFCQILHYVNQAVELFQQESKHLQELSSRHETQLKNANVKLRTVEDTLTASSSLIQNFEKEIENYNQTLMRIQAQKDYYQQHHIHDTDEMLNDLRKKYDLCKNSIQGLQDAQKAEQTLSSHTNKINSIHKEIKMLNMDATNIQNKNGLLNQFEIHTSSILFSLNDNFSILSTPISATDKQIISDFSNLFCNKEGLLSLKENQFPNTPFKIYSEKSALERIYNRIEKLQYSRIELEKERASLHQYSNAPQQDRSQKVSELIAKKDLIESCLRDLPAENSLRHKLHEFQKNLTEEHQQLSIQKEAQLSLKQQIKEFTQQFNTAYSKAQRNINILNKIQEAQKYLGTLSLENRGYLHIVANESSDKILTSITQYDVQHMEKVINSIKKNIDSIHDLNKTIVQSLHTFNEYGFIKMAPEEKFGVTVSSQLFNNYYNSLHNTFETLEAQKITFYSRLQAHNNTVAASIRIINNVKTIISNYIKELNHQLASYQISNLECVAVKAVYHPQYTLAISAMSKMTSSYNSTYPKELYDNIRAFQSEFYVKSSHKIDIAKIINKIHYTFSRNGKTEDIPQSNGTNSMVNAILLAILFNNMIPKDLKIQLPVVFDEVGKLDEENLHEIYKIVTEQSLILFVATPDPTGIIASVLSVYHDLSSFQVTDVEIHGKAKTIYFQGMEERLTNLIQPQN
ncbi:AAA family ATPase [Ignatzschineria sp. LJL83]